MSERFIHRCSCGHEQAAIAKDWVNASKMIGDAGWRYIYKDFYYTFLCKKCVEEVIPAEQVYGDA